MGELERYHAPLRTAYGKIRDTLDNKTSDADCLHTAVFATNATMGPEGLYPMFLVFVLLPRPIRTSPCPTQLLRSTAIEEAKRVVEKEQAKSRIAFALRHPGGPKAQEVSQILRDLPAGYPVLVFRTATKRLESPFKYVSVDGQTAVGQLNRDRRIFRATLLKPYVTSEMRAGAYENDNHDKYKDRAEDDAFVVDDRIKGN